MPNTPPQTRDGNQPMDSRDAAGTETACQEEGTVASLVWCERLAKAESECRRRITAIATRPYVHCWILIFMALYSPEQFILFYLHKQCKESDLRKAEFVMS
jgi:hypothetical protein